MDIVCRRYSVLLFILFAPILSFSFSSADDSVIVEKNIFSPDREKWTMEPYARSSKAAKVKQGKIDDIILSGTIVSDKVKSAVLSESVKKKQGKSSFYLEGDYMSGYLLKKINEKSVILADEQSGEEYVIFLNDGKKNRTAVKTEIKNNSTKRKIDKGLKKQGMAGKPADESLRIKKGLRKNLDSLEKNGSRINLKKAENDLRKLRKLYPQMSGEEKKEVSNLGKKLESLKKKK